MVLIEVLIVIMPMGSCSTNRSTKKIMPRGSCSTNRSTNNDHIPMGSCSTNRSTNSDHANGQL